MGCKQSSPQLDGKTIHAYNQWSRKHGDIDPDKIYDPRLPLTARQVFKLQRSWKAIQRNMQVAGIEMFIG